MSESIRADGASVNTPDATGTNFLASARYLAALPAHQLLTFNSSHVPHTVPDAVPHAVPHSVPRVSFQGAPGAFSELAIQQQWPDGAIPVAQLTFADAIECALRGDSDFAAIPVENAIAGPVHAALTALAAAHGRYVQRGEIKLNVRLCLMAVVGSEIEALQTVMSHPMALAQCHHFFAKHSWLTPVVHNDTASAARDVATQKLVGVAAIASETAAIRYGLEIIARDIQDTRENWTRFVVLRR